MHGIIVTKKGNETTKTEGKSMPLYKRMGWATVEVKDIYTVREKRGTKNNMYHRYVTNIWNENQWEFWQDDRTFNVFQMKKAKEISNFREYQSKFEDQYTLKKADTETFSFLVNDMFANRCLLSVHHFMFHILIISFVLDESPQDFNKVGLAFPSWIFSCSRNTAYSDWIRFMITQGCKTFCHVSNAHIYT